jgi:lipopolysaccharide transport system ATP-binding protein
MSQIAIKVEGLSKAYRLGTRAERSDTLVQAGFNLITAPLRNFRRLRNLDTSSSNRDASDILWALKDVTFEIQRGEVVGFVGRNGAGKSTLLQILSRITEPTTGRVELRGRISSLLEVGTGFHPELSGRENVYMNGTILGMKKREIDARFDEIVAFSGVERFLDTAVKRYSSGMKVRLAFSVAAHLEPEILIIDEVLAVGDAEFQKKCLGKMQDVAGGGRTVLFVSHNMAAIQNLCGRAISLVSGQLLDDGPTDTVISIYLERFRSEATSGFQGNPHRRTSSSAVFTAGRMVNNKGVATVTPCAGEPTTFELDYSASRPKTRATFTLVIFNQNNIPVTVLITSSPLDLWRQGTVRLTLSDTPLPVGKYTADVKITEDDGTEDHVPGAFHFDIFMLKDFRHLDKMSPRWCSALSRQQVEHLASDCKLQENSTCTDETERI